MIALEPAVEGPYNSGCFNATLADGRKAKIGGKEAALLSMLLAGYVLNDSFHPFDAFDTGSLEAGFRRHLANSEEAKKDVAPPKAKGSRKAKSRS